MRLRPSLLMRFTLLGLLTTGLVAAGFGWLMSQRMIADALDATSQDAAETVTFLVTPQARLADFGTPTPATIAGWRQRLGRIVGTKNIVRVKVWNSHAQVVYSDQATLIGRSFPLQDADELRSALGGHVARDISSLGNTENASEREFGRLLEVYVPVILPGSPHVVGAYEVYQRVTPLEARITYAALFVLVSGANRQLLRQETRLRAAFVGTVRALASAVDFKDSDTGTHSSQVADYAAATAHRLGLRGQAVEDIRFAAYLHDLGKIGISDAILKKPGPLTRAEWAEMRRHSVMGAQIVESVDLAPGIKQTIRHNHERWDGAGYPDRLRGEEIPLEARILSVADAYEAMTADRPYRQALGHAAAVEELRRCAGAQFDPLVVDAFLSAIEAIRAGNGRGQVRLA